MNGLWYCGPECLERAVCEALGPARPAARRSPLSHRIPLGLLLLSRRELSAEQLGIALEAQRHSGRGRIGEWLQELGFVTEQQVTRALARQWSCPVLRGGDIAPMGSVLPEIPLRLLESYRMIPVAFVEATSTLHIAFADGIDYTVLYAIEQMVGCRTRPCLICPSSLRSSLSSWAAYRGSKEVVFDRVADSSEIARLVGNYATRVHACQVRMAACGAYAWARLERPAREPVNLVLRLPGEPGGMTLPAPFHAFPRVS